MSPYEYAAEHQTPFLEELKVLLRLQSISALPSHKDEIRRTAHWLVDHLQGIGMARAEIFATAGHPIVFAERTGVPGAPTVLIYGHYDVQPADDQGATEKWRTPPFEPTVVDGNLYARGAADDKGQFFAHLKSIESLIQTTGTLPVNIKILLEGEEEVASAHLPAFLETHQDLLRADVCVISDSHILATNRPVIVYGLRGMTYVEIEVHGPRTDLHSGIYGGVVHNPAQALCEIIAALHHPDGSVSVPGFYDRVRLLTPAERTALAEVPWTDEEFGAETGAPAEWGEPSYTPRERVGARPTLEVNGIVGGFTGDGPKTVLPARALAKVSCRLVANQDPDEVFRLLQQRVKDLTPRTVTSEVRLLNTGHPAMVDIHSPAIEAAAQAYEFSFGARPVFMREGGSIPVVADIQRLFSIPVVLAGFGLPDDNLHAPNEKFNLDHFYRGVNMSIHLMQRLGEVMN